MEKELKFRVWDNVQNKWLLGYDTGQLGGFSIIGEVMLFGEYTKLLQQYRLQELDNLVITSVTGILDKHNQQIYTGDIIAHYIHYASGEPKNLLVKWDSNNCCYRGFYSETEGHVLNNFVSKYIEKIGNIFQNPDLYNSHPQ